MGNNKSATTKNAGESLTISIAIGMRRCDAGRIARYNTSRASSGATGCRHRASACAVSHRRPSWWTNSLKQHKTLTKHNFYLATMVISYPKMDPLMLINAMSCVKM